MSWRQTTIETESHLAASPAQVWPHISHMRGVNAELSPWIRMTFPTSALGLSLASAPVKTAIFSSWVLFLSFLPIDRHHLRFEEVWPGAGFLEDSSTWLHRRWRHERRLSRTERGGTLLLDRITFEPRIPFLTPVIKPLVAYIFKHRHQRLGAYFGSYRN